MGISINEFATAMETYGATRISNRTGSRYNVSVPCFKVGNGVVLMHSGSYYIVQRDNKVPDDIMNKAMAEFGEKHPGGKNFWWGEIHSIPGVITLASMLDGNYDKQRVQELTNETYKKLLANPGTKSINNIVFSDIQTPKMQELRKVLAEYSSLVNPFANEGLKFRDPIEYLDKVTPYISEKGNPIYIELTANTALTKYFVDDSGWSYQSFVTMQKNRRCKWLSISHYYSRKKGETSDDEVIYIDYTDRSKSRYNYNPHPEDVDLRISLKTGLAWETYNIEQAQPATDEQLDFAIACLKESIKKIKSKIINKMTITA